MLRRPSRSTPIDTLFPYTTLFRSLGGPSKLYSLPSISLLMPYLMQASALQFRLLDQITILVGQQMALDLRHCIDRDVYHDQQTSASQIERYTCFGDQEFRN